MCPPLLSWLAPSVGNGPDRSAHSVPRRAGACSRPQRVSPLRRRGPFPLPGKDPKGPLRETLSICRGVKKTRRGRVFSPDRGGFAARRELMGRGPALTPLDSPGERVTGQWVLFPVGREKVNCPARGKRGWPGPRPGAPFTPAPAGGGETWQKLLFWLDITPVWL